MSLFVIMCNSPVGGGLLAARIGGGYGLGGAGQGGGDAGREGGGVRER